jgi:N-acetylmuramic acid 6-phosphate etherase
MPLAMLGTVPTEVRNPRTTEIDVLPTLEILRLINNEDTMVPGAVAAALPQMAKAVDLEVEALRDGGRVHYFGAGTSGRLAVLDAAELPPTYGIDPGLVVAHHAGGMDAISHAIENVEDDAALGARDAGEVNAGDVAVGITASGRTPYVVGALRQAATAGAHTVLISSNPAAAAGSEVEVHIAVDTGPEAV